MDNNLLLSDHAVLVYVLRRSGCVGRLTVGCIERDSEASLNVYRESTLMEFVSGSNLCSWCVVGRDQQPLPGWDEVPAEDRPRLFLRP